MYFKLTDRNMITRYDFHWELGKWYRIDNAVRSQEAELCTSAWFHCYDSKLLAVLLNPIYAKIKEPRLFRANVAGLKRNNKGLKFGFTMMKLSEEIEVPEITVTQRVAFGILCARSVFADGSWLKWATAWLNGSDRSYASAYASASAAASAAHAAHAAHAAEHAADAAADAAYGTDCAAAHAAASAAHAAEHAADAAAEFKEGTFRLKKRARAAMRY